MGYYEGPTSALADLEEFTSVPASEPLVAEADSTTVAEPEPTVFDSTETPATGELSEYQQGFEAGKYEGHWDGWSEGFSTGYDAGRDSIQT